jgi:hypothetical protein
MPPEKFHAASPDCDPAPRLHDVRRLEHKLSRQGKKAAVRKNREHGYRNSGKDGVAYRARTGDPWIHNPMLYQLS